ncbi:hypothetical protein MPSEU_000102500 [Mayamaea pseudoterrestris]|nr:hypothetical protein MPSEU_000102500 [Mayamaea pseudoterrestris]
MPSWLSPKVGTVPQAGQPSRKDRRSRKEASKKGITMEDLKKQTALRLAHEQKKRPTEGSKGPSPTAAGPTPSMPPSSMVYSPHHQGPPAPNHYDMPHSSIPGMVPQTTYGVVPFASPGPSMQGPPVVPVNVESMSNFQKQGSAQDLSNSKLPHGLTVQELKEMTKARLQAEASKAEVSSMERREQPPAISPLPMQHPIHSSQSRSRTQSRDGWSQCSRGDADEYSVCSTTSDFPGSESAFGVSGPSPAPSPFTPNRAYLGSYGSVAGAGSPLPEMVAFTGSGSMAFGGTPDYYNANRRRAQTLSPRQGLSYVDEERQVLPSQQFHGMPSFGSPMINSQYSQFSNNSSVDLIGGLPTRPNMLGTDNRARTYSLDPTSISDRAVGSPDWLDNRPRTSSAASLPATSQTAEEFFMMEPPQFQRSSFHRLSTEIGVLDEEHVSRPSVTGLADVFRKSPPPGFGTSTTGRGAVDALGSHNSTVQSSSAGLGNMPFYGGGGDVRSRASTWAPDSMFGTSSPSGGLGMEELAAILKLSEAE